MGKAVDRVEVSIFDENEVKKLVKTYLKNSSIEKINKDSLLSDLADSYRKQNQTKFADDLDILQQSLSQATGSTKEFVAQSASNVFFKESNNIFSNIIKTFVNRIFGKKDQDAADLAISNLEQISRSGSKAKNEFTKEQDINLSQSQEPNLSQNIEVNTEKEAPLQASSQKERSALSSSNTNDILPSSPTPINLQASPIPTKSSEPTLPPLPPRNNPKEFSQIPVDQEAPIPTKASEPTLPPLHPKDNFKESFSSLPESSSIPPLADVPLGNNKADAMPRNLLDQIAAGAKLKPVDKEAQAIPRNEKQSISSSENQSFESEFVNNPMIAMAQEAENQQNSDSAQIRSDSEWKDSHIPNSEMKQEAPRQTTEAQVMNPVIKNLEAVKSDAKEQKQNITRSPKEQQEIDNALKARLDKISDAVNGKSKEKSEVDKLTESRQNKGKSNENQR